MHLSGLACLSIPTPLLLILDLFHIFHAVPALWICQPQLTIIYQGDSLRTSA